MKKKINDSTKKVLRNLKKRISKDISSLPIGVPCKYSIDSPLKSVVDKKTVTVEGWIIPIKGVSLNSVRIKYGDTVYTANHGLKRIDVAKAFPDDDNALMSGFHAELSVSDGLLTLEADFGNGFIQLHAIDIRYSPEQLIADVYNPRLAENYAEHSILLENKKKYYHEPDLSADYERNPNDPRLMAFYLPQFHPIKENDHVWGKNFTEWTNVTGDTPRFIGHRQPILPKDTGFYDLRLEENIVDQIGLAKKHGIYGFCFYYYWFSGKRLLEKPLDSFLNHKEWDFNFTICWANENWTKRWDGRDSEVIVAQKYEKDDPLKFIKDVEHILLDPRYVRENDKPVLLVFRASEMKQPEEYAAVWRNYFRKMHKTELHLVSIVSFEDKDPRDYGFDAGLDFAPQSSFFKNDAFTGNRYPHINVSDKLIDINFAGSVADYRAIALNKNTYEYFDFPTYKCVTPSWDNDARKKNKGFVMYNESPDVYAKWLKNILDIETEKAKSPMVFINAWNEWAEGAVLEPTAHYGHAILNRTTEVLSKFSSHNNLKNFPLNQIQRKSSSVKLAVVIHLYYPEKWQFFAEKLNNIEMPYDLYVTLNIKDAEFSENIYSYKKDAFVRVVPNRGRDVLPFIYLADKLNAAGYEYVLKLHSKKSKHRNDGSEWLESIVDNLLPNKLVVNKIMKALSNEQTAIVGPDDHLVSLVRHMGSNAKELENLITKALGNEMSIKAMANLSELPYFGGTMFWMRLDALSPILDLTLLPEDFAAEKGQVDGTMAHALERAFSVIPQLQGKSLYASSVAGLKRAKLDDPKQKYKHAP